MRRITRILGGLIKLLALLVGWPLVLLHLPDRPTLPRHLPDRATWIQWAAQPTARTTAITGFIVLLWLLYAVLLFAVIADGCRLLRPAGRWLRRVRLPGPLQSLSAAVLGTVAVSTASTGTPTPAAAHAVTTDLPHQAPTLRLAAHSPTRPADTTTATPATAPPAATDATYTVRRGDTLWGIAGHQLGDPTRWVDIYHLNQARYDQHGRMRHGDHIEPGWTLTLSGDTTPPAAAPPVPAPQDPSGGQHDPGTGPAAPSGGATPTPSTSVASPHSGAATSVPGTAPSTVGGADGVTGPPAAGTVSPAASPTPGAAPSGSPHRHGSGGVTLTSGSWLDTGLATAILAAAALVWTHRRRRYTHRPPTPALRLDNPGVTPMPPVIREIRRHLRHLAPGPHPTGQREPRGADPDDRPNGDLPGPATQDTAPDTPPPADLDLDLADEEDDTAAEDRNNHDDVDGDVSVSPAHRGTQPVATYPAGPSLTHSLADVWPPAGLGLTGPGAPAAARGFLATALAATGAAAPHDRTRVVIAGPTTKTLLGTTGSLPASPRLTVTTGLDEALDLLDAQTLHRSRILHAHDLDTVAALRAADPAEEPLPPILLLADAPTGHQRTRVAALLTQGRHLDIHGVLLGDWPDGDTITVAADGTTTPADRHPPRPGHHPADIGRLAVLTPTETSDLLATLTESHTGQPPAPTLGESATTRIGRTIEQPPTPDSRCQPPPGQPADDRSGSTVSTPDAAPDLNQTPSAAPPLALDGRSTGDQPPTAQTPPPPAALSTTSQPGHIDSDAPTAAAPAGYVGGTDHHDPAVPPPPRTVTDAEATAGPATAGAQRGRVEVTVLGTPAILDLPPGPTPRKKSLELLVYLAVHDGTATVEAILDDLMPDIPASKAPGRLYTYISDLRTIMRRTGGPATYLTHPDQRYTLDPDTIDIDLWRMRTAIGDANHTTDPADRITALRRAVDTYSGHLAEGADYEWIEPYREAVRQQALDAHLALTDALQGNPAAQITVLDAAIAHHPHTEDLYQHAMRARAALGHLDAIRTLRRALTRALSEIDAEPTDETIALADQLVAGLQRPGRRPHPRPTTPPDSTGTQGAAA